jgi:magnesium transporter
VHPNILPDLNSTVRESAVPARVRLSEVETVSEALARVRRDPWTHEMIYFYVTDTGGHLVGVVSARGLLLAEPSTLIGELMVHPVFSVREHDPFGTAVSILAEQRLLALPVIDDLGRLTGILDVSSVTGALVELERQGSVGTQLPKLQVSAGGRGGAFFPSLMIAVVMAVITAAFKDMLSRSVALVFLIPAVLAVGNSGARWAVSATLTGTGTTRSRWLGVTGLRNQVMAVAGLLAAVAIGGRWFGGLPVALSAGVSFTLSFCAAVAIGCLAPRLLHHGRLARAAVEPAVLALANVVALSCYLTSAMFLLG